jgi:hypothetical protein
MTGLMCVFVFGYVENAFTEYFRKFYAVQIIPAAQPDYKRISRSLHFQAFTFI